VFGIVMHDDDESDWSRMDWARWWLDRGDVDSAVEWLQPGDEVRSTDTEFAALAEAVSQRGLRALHAEGVAYVYLPEEAAHIEGLLETRKAPARAATPVPRRKSA
jgi:hypothetical protein